MAKPWSEVENSPNYQSLSDNEKQIAKEQYFKEVVVPKPEFKVLQDSQKQAAYNEFIGIDKFNPTVEQTKPQAKPSLYDVAVKKVGSVFGIPENIPVPTSKDIATQLSPVAATVSDTAKDVGTVFAHGLNQALLNAPRYATEKLGAQYPNEASNPVSTAVARGAGIAGGIALNPIAKVTGLGNMATKGAQAIMTNPFLSKATVKGLTDLAVSGAGLGILSAPNADEKKTIAQELIGDAPTRGVAGAVIGSVLPLSFKGASEIGKLITKIPEGLKSSATNQLNWLIRPLKKDFSYSKIPGRGLAEERIVAANPEDLANQVSEKLKLRGEEIDSILSTPENSKKTIDLERVINLGYAQALNKAIKENDSPLINRLNNDYLAIKNNLELVGKEIVPVSAKKLNGLSPVEATEIKRFIGDLTKFTGIQVSNDTDANKILKSIYGQIKSKINEAVPEVAKLNERYADLHGAASAIRNLMNVPSRNNPFSLQDMMFTGAGLSFGANPVNAALGYIASKTAKSTLFNTLLSRGLMKASDLTGDIRQAISPTLTKAGQLGEDIATGATRFYRGKPISPAIEGEVISPQQAENLMLPNTQVNPTSNVPSLNNVEYVPTLQERIPAEIPNLSNVVVGDNFTIRENYPVTPEFRRGTNPDLLTGNELRSRNSDFYQAALKGNIAKSNPALPDPKYQYGPEGKAQFTVKPSTFEPRKAPQNLTKEEFINMRTGSRGTDEQKRRAVIEHKKFIREAIKAGKDINPATLRNYPDLDALKRMADRIKKGKRK